MRLRDSERERLRLPRRPLRDRGKLDLQRVDEGFNKIKPWLSKKLKARRMSVERFAVAMGSTVTSTAIMRWYSDTCRPYPRAMVLVCETLSRLPVYRRDGSCFWEHVPASEGLSKYAPRPRAWVAHYLNRPTPDR